MGLTPRMTYKPPPSIDSYGICQKILGSKNSDQPEIDNQLSAALSFTESKGIDAHENVDKVHIKRKIPKRMDENRDNAASLTILEKLSSTRKKYFQSLIQ